MFGRLASALARLFGFATEPAASTQTGERVYTIKSFDDRGAAVEAARQEGVAALVRSANRNKWLLLKCPCGCGQQIALNLMQSHSPRWRVDMRPHASFSVHPSVDSRTCGAHFWLRDGRVIWCQ